MRCSLCQARLDPDLHQRHDQLLHLRARLNDWAARGSLPAPVHQVLLRDVAEEMERVVRQLRPPPPPKPRIIEDGIRIIEPPRVVPRAIPALAPSRVEGPPPKPAPPPPEEPRAFFRNLATPRNVRWLLNLGIFIFSACLAVFVYTRWERLDTVGRMVALFGGTAALLGAGHPLRGTLLSNTGRALQALGAIALPIDFFAVVHGRLFPAVDPSAIGTAGAFNCALLYAALALTYRERRYSYLALTALAGLWIFGAHWAGLAWGLVACSLPPLILAGLVLYHFVLEGSATDRRLWIDPAFYFLHTALASAAGWMVAAVLPGIGLLDLRGDWPAIVGALASCFLFYNFSAWRTGMTSLAAVGLPFLLVGFADLVWGLRVPPYDLGLWVVFFGILLSAPMRPARLRVLTDPLAILGGAAICSGLVMSLAGWAEAGDPGLRSMIQALTAAGAFGVIASLVRPVAWPAGAGLALLTAAGHLTIVLWDRPLTDLAPYYGSAAALLAGLSFSLPRLRAAMGVALTAAAVALAFLLPPAPYYFTEPLLGLWAAAGAAVALSCVKEFRDCAWGAAAIGAVMALRAAGLPHEKMGLGVALLAAALVAASRLRVGPSPAPAIVAVTLATLHALAGGGLYGSLTLLSLSLVLATLHLTKPHPCFGAAAVLWHFAGYAMLMNHANVEILTALRGALVPTIALLALTVRAGRRDLARPVEVTALVALTAIAALGLHDPDVLLFAGILVTATAHQAVAPRERLGDLLRMVPVLLAAGAAILLEQGEASVLFAMVGLYAALGALPADLSVFAFAASWTSLMAWLGVAPHEMGLAMTPFLAASLWVHPRATLITLAAVTGGILVRADVWDHLPPSITMALIVAGGAVLHAWRRPEPAIPILVASLYAALAHFMTIRHLMPDGVAAGPALLLGAAALSGAGILLKRGAPVGVGLALSLVAIAVGFDQPEIRGWTVLLAGLLYFGLAVAERRLPLVFASATALLAADFLLVQSTGYDPHVTGNFLIPTSLVMMAMGWDLKRRHGTEFGAPMGLAGLATALVATAIVWNLPLELGTHLTYDALLLAGMAVVLGVPWLMTPASMAFTGALAAFLAHDGMGLPQALCVLTVACIVQALAALVQRPKSKDPGQVESRLGLDVGLSDALLVGALASALAVQAVGAVWTRAYAGVDGWGMLATGLAALLFGGVARVRPHLVLTGLSAAFAFALYGLACRHFELHATEFRTIPLGAALLLWNERKMRRILMIDWTGMAVLLGPPLVRGFDRAADPQSAVFLAAALGLVLAGMALRRRIFLLTGSFAFVSMTMAKAVQVLVETEASWTVWGLLLGTGLIVLAAVIEATARGRMARLQTAAGEYFADWQ